MPKRSRAHAAHVCINAVRGCVVAAMNAGLALDEVVALIGIDAETLSDPDARVPAGRTYRAWDLVAERLDDPLFGLRAAEALHVALFDAYDFAVTSATTMRDGLERMMRHLRLQHDGAEIRLAIDGDEACVSVVFYETDGLPHHFCEFVVAVWLLRARSFITQRFAPRRLRFRHASQADPAEYARVLGVRPAFSAGADCVTFDAAFLEQPLVSANPALGRLMDGYLGERQERVPDRQPVAVRARTQIELALREGTPSVSVVARQMAVSVRTLQRALSDAGTSFDALLDETRRALALGWVHDPGRSFKQLSNDLGFGQPTAFTRAFRRWTGQSPSQYRASLTPRATEGPSVGDAGG